MDNEYYVLKITPMSWFDINNFPNRYINEISALSKFTNKNFIQKLISSFYDFDNLYFISKLYSGSVEDHWTYKWNENQIKFFSACLIQTFIELRKENYIHRDIHYWNLLLDEKKYVVLIDFHIAINYKYKNDPQYNIIGSPLFCAPEMIQEKEYDYNSDYYRLGVMLYYNIFRKYPNIIRNSNNLTDVKIDYNKNIKYSNSCIDFINKLIISDKKKRIGFYSVDELKDHDFFNNFNWNELINKKMKSPFKKKRRRTSGACNVLFNFTKREFITNDLLKNITFKNILFSYNNLNNKTIDNILKSFSHNYHDNFNN